MKTIELEKERVLEKHLGLKIDHSWNNYKKTRDKKYLVKLNKYMDFLCELQKHEPVYPKRRY